MTDPTPPAERRCYATRDLDGKPHVCLRELRHPGFHNFVAESGVKWVEPGDSDNTSQSTEYSRQTAAGSLHQSTSNTCRGCGGLAKGAGCRGSCPANPVSPAANRTDSHGERRSDPPPMETPAGADAAQNASQSDPEPFRNTSAEW